MKKIFCSTIAAVGATVLAFSSAVQVFAFDEDITGTTDTTITASTEKDTGIWGDVTWTLEGDTLTFSGTGKMPTLESLQNNVPEIYNAELEQDDFRTYYPWAKYRMTVKNLVIEDGVQNLPNGAFAYFYQLESITFPETPLSVESFAFYAIRNDIVVGNVTMQTFTIPENVTLDGIHIFTTSPKDLVTIRAKRYSQAYYYALKYNYTIEETGVLPNVVTSGTCGEQVTWRFDFDSRTLYIEGTGTAEAIANVGAFSTLVEKIVFGEGITEIQQTTGTQGGNMLYGVKEITLPSTLHVIGTSACSNYENLKTVTIPDGVTTIENYAFSGCEGMTAVVIPESVTSIGTRAFPNYDWTNLTIYGYEDSVAQTYAIENDIPFIALTNASEPIGDVNEDGIVNLIDAIFINKYLSGAVVFTDQQIQNANCDRSDGTGTVNEDDVTALLNYTIQLTDTLPISKK